MTYDQFCTNYTPGRYARDTTPDAIERDAETLQRILAWALYRLDEHRRAA